MSEHMKTVVAEQEVHEATFGKYIAGFVSSVVLTLASYLLVTSGSFSTAMTVGLISMLAVVQFVVQMLFFLHIGDERGPRWKLLVLVFMVGTVLLIVFGSIWIMNSLNYRMTPEQQQHYLNSQDSL